MSQAIANHNMNKDGSGAAASVAVTLPSSTAGNALIACGTTFNSGGAKNIDSVSDGTTTYTRITGTKITWTGTFANVITEWFMIPQCAAGRTTHTLTVTGATTFLELMVWEVSGFTLPQADVFQSNGTAGSTGASNLNTGPALTPSAVATILAACGTDTGSIDINPNTGNEFSSGGNNSGDAFCALVNATVAAHTPVWHDTGATDHFTSSLISFIETPASISAAQEAGIWAAMASGGVIGRMDA